MRNIILASASPRRKELLERAGISFSVCPSRGEENLTSEAPEKAVLELSAQKCREVFERSPADALVIGADTVVAVDGQLLGKPKTKEEAVQMLELLEGRTHEVYTGVTVLTKKDGLEELEKCFTFYEKTEVTFYRMEKEEILAYVETGEPMDKAGAYGIQGKSAVFIKGISGDYNNVVGLPMARLYQEFKKRGLR